MRKQHKITLTVLALVATLPFFFQQERPYGAGQSELAQPAEAPQSEPASTLAATLPVRAEMPEFRGDAFSTGVLNAPRRASQTGHERQRPAASTPSVPPNPYRFAGEVRQSGATRRFLVRGDAIVEVKAGDVLQDGYRVDAVDGHEVVLVHAASGFRQNIALSTPGAVAAPAALAVPATPAAPAVPWILLGAPGERTPPKALREG